MGRSSGSEGADRVLCLQYQVAFMKLPTKDKVAYISEMAPYQSPFWHSADWTRPALTPLYYSYMICVVWMWCALKIVTCEYYYGFIRALLVNDDSLFAGAEGFHKWMLRSFQIVSVLETYTVTHAAVNIVSYLPEQ